MVGCGLRLSVNLQQCVHKPVIISATGKTAMFDIAAHDDTFPFWAKILRTEKDYAAVDEMLIGDPAKTIWIFDRFDLFHTKELWECPRRETGKSDYDRLLRSGYNLAQSDILVLDRFDLFANSDLWRYVEHHRSS